MRLQITPTTDGEVQEQFITFKDLQTGKDRHMTSEEAIYWGNRAIQVNANFCNGDQNEVTVRLIAQCV